MKPKSSVTVACFLPVGLSTYQHPCISFDASLVLYINSTNIPPIMIINRMYETQNLLSLRTYQHSGTKTVNLTKEFLQVFHSNVCILL
jgi:hypothetical protein